MISKALYPILLTLLFISCTSRFNSSQLSGRWKVAMKDVVSGQYSNSRYYFEFYEDGGFSAKVELHESSNGTWRMSEDSIFLKIDENVLEGIVERHLTDSAELILLQVVQRNAGDKKLEMELRR